MKRFFLVSTLLLVALMMGAQTKVAPKMKKGMKKVYVTECTITSDFSQPVTVTEETVYEVVDETDDGYILDVYVTDVKTNADKNDAESRMLSFATEMLKDVHTKYATDKDGKVITVLDAEDVENKVDGILDNMLDKAPLPDSTSKSELKDELKKQVSKQQLTESLQISASPLALNGKTISTGTEEDYYNPNAFKGLNLKRIYTVNGNKISSSANLNMNSKDISNLVSGVIDAMAPGEIDDDALAGLNSLFEKGNLKCSEENTYTLGKDGWMKDINSEMKASAMGMSIAMKYKVTLK